MQEIERFALPYSQTKMVSPGHLSSHPNSSYRISNLFDGPLALRAIIDSTEFEPPMSAPTVAARRD
jgi:hypothetical protein